MTIAVMGLQVTAVVDMGVPVLAVVLAVLAVAALVEAVAVAVEEAGHLEDGSL